MNLLFITNRPEDAILAENAGADRIFVDLEYIGKVERQGHLDTLISRHNISDVAVISNVLRKAELMVRINPWFEGSRSEIEACLAAGAKRLMLPMFKTPSEVEAFLAAVNKRCACTLLLETPEAVARLGNILNVQGIDEIHLGLNDLHIGLNLDFMFELLSGGIADHCAKMITDAGVKFGCGGIATLGEGAVRAEMVLGEYARLGSQAVILSRGFREKISTEPNRESRQQICRNEINKIRVQISQLTHRNSEAIHADRELFCDAVSDVLRKLKARNAG